MALQLGLLHEALKEAGVSEELARRASEEVAAYENQIAGLRSDIASLRAYVDQQFAALRAYIDLHLERVAGRLNLHSWMLGSLLAVALAILAKLLVHE